LPLRVVKSAVVPELDISWSDSCSPSHSDYAIHEGSIGAYYSHVGLMCSTANLTSATLAPGATSRYYIAVALTASHEGSYGLDSFGVERPVSTSGTCAPLQDIGCP
jgi:hypothetical protein